MKTKEWERLKKILSKRLDRAAAFSSQCASNPGSDMESAQREAADEVQEVPLLGEGDEADDDIQSDDDDEDILTVSKPAPTDTREFTVRKCDGNVSKM